MTTTHRIPLLIALAATLSIPASLASPQLFDAGQTARNSALAASPRSLEAYPWIAFQTSDKSVGTTRSTKSTAGFATVKKHGSLAATPRMVEEYPQLAFQQTTDRKAARTVETPALLRNQALAASPRMIEEFPALGLPPSATPPPAAYEIAPLK